MKNKKRMIIILSIIIILLIILTVLITRQKGEKQNNNIINNNDISKSENIIVNNNINENNITTNNINENSTNNTVQTDPVSSSPKEAFTKYLNDESLVRNNLYLKKDCFDKSINDNEEQTVKFIKLDDESWSAPVVIVCTECKSHQSNQCYILTYNQGNIKVKSMDDRANSQSHTSYKVNKKDKIIFKESHYSEGEYYTIYSITEDGIQNICSIKRLNQIQDSNTETVPKAITFIPSLGVNFKCGV